MERFATAALRSLTEVKRDYAIANAWAETDFTDKEFYSTYETGVTLYNDIIGAFWDVNKESSARITEIPPEDIGNTKGSIEQFLDFAARYKNNDVSLDWDTLLLMVGEGHAISNARHTIHAYDVKEYEVIAGPYMVRDAKQTEVQEGQAVWKGYVNDYIEELLETKQGCAKVYRNKYIPFHKMFLGMFHFYLRGDCFLVERAHKYGEDQSRSKIIMQDKKLALRLKEYFEHYSRFTEKGEDGLFTDFCTYSKSLFSRVYTNEFVEEIKHDYGHVL